MGKINILKIVAAHFRTLRNYNTGKPSVRDWLMVVGAPLILGFLARGRGAILFSADYLQSLVTFVALLTLVCGMMLGTLYRRWRDAHVTETGPQKVRTEFAHEICSNACYGILAGMFTIAALFGGALVRHHDSTIRTVFSAAAVALVCHFSLVFMMTFSRLHTFLLKTLWSGTRD